jgi:hypothetical protein
MLISAINRDGARKFYGRGAKPKKKKKNSVL